MTNGNFESRALALLSWLDTFERTDALILEIRHVQETIASQLRSEQFYEPFRYEDHYLWGRYTSHIKHDVESIDWYHVLTALPSVSEGCEILSKVWCPEFPPREGSKVAIEVETRKIAPYRRWFDYDAHMDCVNECRKRRHIVSVKNTFHANDDRLYDALRYLQLLKRDILRDKLILAYRALELFPQDQDSPSDRDGRKNLDPLACFLIFRRGALHGLHARLSHFRDVVSTVQEVLNLSLERDPTPTVRRRRDQGIYTTDLSDSCRQIAREIESFLTQIRFGDVTSDGYVDHDEQLEFLIHRYTRAHTSTVRVDESPDNTSRTDSQRAAEIPAPRAAFVLSSFWMPERPDLQPTIAHEVAHTFIKRDYQDLSPIALDGMDDPLALLLREVSYVFEQYSSRFVYFIFSPRNREVLLTELACELIGIAVHQTSYIFAQFLELVGFGTEDLFDPAPTVDIAQTNVQLQENIPFLRDRRPEWYLRIMLPLAFLRAVSGKTRDQDHRVKYLEDLVQVGIATMTERIRYQLSNWMDGEQKEDWETWFEMTNVLVETIERSSFVRSTVDWLRTGRIDKLAFWKKRAWVSMPYSRYLPGLSDVIKNDCLGAWLDRLLECPRMLGEYIKATYPPGEKVTDTSAREAFRKLYLNSPQIVEYQRTDKPERRLFGHLIDIPWQTASLTAHDFLGCELAGQKYALPYSQWLTAIHEFSWLGRDMYHTALEFIVWHERPSIGRLKAANRWLSSAHDAIKDAILRFRDIAIVAGLDPLQAMLSRILGSDYERSEDDNGLPTKLSSSLQGLMDRLVDGWPPKEMSGSDLEMIRNLSLAEICDVYPDYNYNISPTGVSREIWRDIFDYIADVKMNDARSRIHRSIREFIEQNQPFFEAPETNQVPSWRDRVRNILFELIRIRHYLSVRPGTKPRTEFTEHSDIVEDSWDAVFLRYLDVPIQARKLEGSSTSQTLDCLVPTRSIRIDRFSIPYERHLSSSARKVEKDAKDRGQTTMLHKRGDKIETYEDYAASTHPGHVPSDTLSEEAPVFWVPWGLEGTRADASPGELCARSMSTPLLGRFDRLSLHVGKHTIRLGPKPPQTPYFRRQQNGLPFAAQNTPDGKIHRLSSGFPFPTLVRCSKNQENQTATDTLQEVQKENAVPLAAINMLLTQRSVRLTFVERLIAENLVAKSYHKEFFSSPYKHFRPDRDIGLLTDGWGDIFLILLAEYEPLAEEPTFDDYVVLCSGLRRRLANVIKLRQALFEDTLVVRTETSYTPLAVDAALLDPEAYNCTISVRLRPTLNATPLCEIFEEKMRRGLSERINIDEDGQQKSLALSDLFSISRVPGRTDYLIRTNKIGAKRAAAVYRRLCVRCEGYDSYGIIFETLRNKFFHDEDDQTPDYITVSEHIESTATTIGEDMLKSVSISPSNSQP
jgi:hypothetical protein